MGKWEDTVINKDEMRLYCAQAYREATGESISPFAIDMTCPPKLCEVQAKITWDIAFKVGVRAEIKKVLEFIDWLDDGTRSSPSWREEMRNFGQAKLKELGLK